jgi:hypothetical protein
MLMLRMIKVAARAEVMCNLPYAGLLKGLALAQSKRFAAMHDDPPQLMSSRHSGSIATCGTRLIDERADRV